MHDINLWLFVSTFFIFPSYYELGQVILIMHSLFLL